MTLPIALWVPHESPFFPIVQTFPVKPEAEPYCLTQAEVLAIKALKAGNANSYQQQMALEAIVTKVAGTHDMSFRPGADGDRATAFAEGRRYAGLMIVRAINLPFKASGDQPNAGSPDPTQRKNPKPGSGTPRRNPRKRDPGANPA